MLIQSFIQGKDAFIGAFINAIDSLIQGQDEITLPEESEFSALISGDFGEALGLQDAFSIDEDLAISISIDSWNSWKAAIGD